MKIGEAAARAGVNAQTLRFYERRGLLQAPMRSASGYRAYSDEAVRTLAAEKILELDRKITMLTSMHTSLERLVKTCDRPRARRECPSLEALVVAAAE